MTVSNCVATVSSGDLYMCDSINMTSKATDAAAASAADATATDTTATDAAAAAATAASGAVWQAPTKRPVPEPDIGIAQGIKKQVKDALGQDDRKREWEEAQRYEERRAAEEKEKLARRLEESRRRRR